ncbi:hypothetical protein [Fulvivirga ligni]|uniref:hypothetical protein n=1 Tax=Fulvivirga ligni TaxID=2904246 RepID=UPI001F49000A|nr:hypothetical protein [Fulvivirga ligni]UII22077.1 hypothetical protein LVD16_02385 [Fulvivirga ligni]
MQNRSTSIFILVFLFFFAMLHFPILGIFNVDISIGGVPALSLYLLASWILLIIVLWWLSKKLFNDGHDGN